MDRDEFMELVYETFTDEPDNVLANGIIEAADAYVEHEKAKLFSEGTTKDAISRQAVLDAIVQCTNCGDEDTLREYVLKHSLDNGWTGGILEALDAVKDLPPVQSEQRYTEEELRVFQHGISLSLLSKRSAQHWQYDEDTATEIKFLERLYEKVGADMRGEQNE